MVYFDKTIAAIAHKNKKTAYTVQTYHLIQICIRIFFQPLRPRTTSTVESAAAAPPTI